MIARTEPKLRVLHVLHDLSAAGAQRIVLALAKARGDELTQAVVCLDQFGALTDQARALGIEVHCTRRREGIDWRQIGRIAAILRDFRPDVVHAHQYTPYFYAALAASVAGAGRIIFTEHGRHWPDVVSPSRRACNQLFRLRRDHKTAVCRFVADALVRRERIASRDVRVIANGIDCTELDRPSRRQWLCDQVGAAPGDVLLVLVGRFHSVKDHATAVRAMAGVARAGRRAKLLLVGDGPLEGQIRGQVAELGLPEAVQFLGLRSDVPDLLASADGFVCSSVSEGASLAILEAMAAGLPVAATNVGGNGELVLHERTGLLSRRGDADALAGNLIRLIDQPALRVRLGCAGRRRARARYDQTMMHDAFVNLYRTVAREAQ